MKPSGNKSSAAWLRAHVRDPYVRAAQQDGYRSRAAYKLREMDARFALLQPGAAVVDLGSAPGAWCQYARQRLRSKPGGRIIALDLLPMQPVDGVQFIQGDVRDAAVMQQVVQALGGRAVDVLLSDMAPNLSGQASVDAARVAHLLDLALDFAAACLHPGGTLLLKAFHGSGYEAFAARLRQCFVQFRAYKPKASRGQSAEVYLWAKTWKNQ